MIFDSATCRTVFKCCVAFEADPVASRPKRIVR